ncbi:MAG: hypothetical protein IJX05_05280 [Clostridia bacterium]|nr:hypothetical protein [Clostridia bacterium]
MALTKKQAELDVNKWLKSEEAGHDLCGEFDFCANCDKEKENPCAKAYDAFKKANKPAPKKRTCKAKAEAEVVATEVKTEEKKPATKRKCAKKA